MNFVFSTVVLIIILLPGPIFINAYYHALIKKNSAKSRPFNEIVFSGLFLTIVIHAFAICITHQWLKKEINFRLLYSLIMGKDLSASLSDHEFRGYVLDFLLYNIIVIPVSFLASKAIKLVITKLRWDLRIATLDRTNFWFNIFNGRYFHESNVPVEINKIKLVFVDILVEEDILYSGIYAGFEYSSEQDAVINIILKEARKRKYLKGETENTFGQPEAIDGSVFILPLSKVCNLNITYAYYHEKEAMVQIPESNSMTG